MNVAQLGEVLQPLLGIRGSGDTTTGLDQVELLVGWASRLTAELQDQGDGADLDRDLVTTLSYVVLVGETLRRDVGLRGRVEAFLVQEGWPALKTRLLFRSLEVLPDKPRSLEETLVADAYGLLQLGPSGFARHLSATAGKGEPIAAALQKMRAALTRRFYTRPAQLAATQRRAALKEMMVALERDLSGG